MANKNFIVKNGLEVGGQEVVSSSGVVTSAALGGQTLASTDSPTFNNLTLTNDIAVGGDLNLTGDLNITGDVNSLSVTDLDVTDKTITLGAGQVESASGGSGIIVDGSSASILWNETNSVFDFNKDISLDNGLFFSSQDFYLYRSAADVATLRVGDSGSYKYFQFTDTGTVARFNSASGAVSLGSGANDHLLINSSGNVGIGVSPANKLEIQHGTIGTGNGSNNTLALRYNSTTLYGQHYMDANGLYHIRADAQGVSGGNLILGGDNSVQIWTGSTPESRVTVDASGNCGIGGSPTTSLHIKKSGANGSYGRSPVDSNLIIENTNTSVTESGYLILSGYMGNSTSQYQTGAIGGGKQEAAGNGFYGGYLNFWTTSGGGNGEANSGQYERMRIDQTGNVGIGTTSPNTKLHVEGGFVVRSSSSSVFNDSNNAENVRMLDAGIIFNADGVDKDFTIKSDNNAAMFHVDAGNDNIGIGTTSPERTLDVNGIIHSQGVVGSGGGQLFMKCSNANSSDDGLFGRIKSLNNGGTTMASIESRSESTGNNAAHWEFFTNSGSAIANRMRIRSNGTVQVFGALSKGSGSFEIAHPLESKKDTHLLRHSFIEGPQCDNIYRGTIDLVSGTATVDLDAKFTMTNGTFVALNRNVQVFTTNETDWDNVKGSIVGNVLTITCQNNNSTAKVSWLVVGERQDDNIKSSEITNNEGKLILEPEVYEGGT